MNTKIANLQWLVCIIVAFTLLTPKISHGTTSGSEGKLPFQKLKSYLKKDLVLYYTFDQDIGAKVKDISGNGNQGKIHGAELIADGKFGSSGFFDGSDDCISVENIHLQEFTLAAWIKTSTGNLNNRRVFLFDSDSESFFAVQGATASDMEFNTVVWREDENEWDDEGVETDNVKLKVNTWTHIAVSFNGTRAAIYLNGRLIQMKQLHREGFTGILYIGGIEARRGRFWHGMIDEVAVFKRALIAAEIRHIYDPYKDNPVLELKAYCESKKESSPQMLDILERVATEMQNENIVDPNLQCGRGVARFYEIQKKSEQKGECEKDEEERIIYFQFKGNSSRSEIYSGQKDKIKILDWILAENPEYGIRSDGDDIDIEDNRIGIFHREIGYDMHPDTFNKYCGYKPSEFLLIHAKWAKKQGINLSVNINNDEIMQLAYVHAFRNEKHTMRTEISVCPPARFLSFLETEEKYGEQRSKSRIMYNINWQWSSNQCYIKDLEYTKENTEFDNDNNSEQSSHEYEHKEVELLAYEAGLPIPDSMFTLSGLTLTPDTEVQDRLKKAEYTLGDVLNGKIKPGQHYKSLIGAKLPNLNMFMKNDFNALIRNKTTLICFFDMQQRSSRYYLAELAKRQRELKEKGLIVLTVQASKVNRDKLNDWIQKNAIPFPLGMIEDDDKTRAAWGVCSLPWLTLTNKQHIVQAEGFGINELGERINDLKEK